MKFNSTAGQEFRTWILFFVGIALAIIFALNGNPLNPWWTLVIGAFTCTAIIVSAVQAVTGGMTDAARKAIEEQLGKTTDNRSNTEKPDSTSLSIAMGPFGPRTLWGVCSGNAITIQ